MKKLLGLASKNCFKIVEIPYFVFDARIKMFSIFMTVFLSFLTN